MTQPAVSRAVARLEERVGIRIFNRTARAITLTDEGRRFYEAVAPLLAGIEDAAIDAGQSKARVRGGCASTSATFGHYVLAPKMAEFLDRFPDLSVEISVRDRMGDLVADGFDVAVRFGIPEPSSYRARLLRNARADLRVGGLCRAPRRTAAPAGSRERASLRADPRSGDGRPFEWEFHRGKEVVPFDAAGRLMVRRMLGACLGGAGLPSCWNSMRATSADGRLVLLLPEWADETFRSTRITTRPTSFPRRCACFSTSCGR